MCRIIARIYYVRLLDTIDISSYAFHDACADLIGRASFALGAKKTTEEATDGSA